jgi:hypothetical protein
MFERYTEKARRCIFFARYEASMFGSPYIETEHLLLGILREDTKPCARKPNLIGGPLQPRPSRYWKTHFLRVPSCAAGAPSIGKSSASAHAK